MEALTPESLKVFLAIIKLGSDSYLGYAAYAAAVAGVVLYLLSVRQGISPLNLIAYLFTLLFIALAGVAAYYASASGKVKSIYYAGGNERNFNVGRFMRLSEDTWDDTSLARVTVSNLEQQINPYTFNYKVSELREGNRIFLKGTDLGREEVIIEIDLLDREIFYLAPDGKRRLYKIIAQQ